MYPMGSQQTLAIVAMVAMLACIGILLAKRRAPGALCSMPRAHACGGPTAVLYELKGSNPCALVRARIGEDLMAFCIDTGFAGPCLLSLPCLSRAPPLRLGDSVVAWAERAQAAVVASRVSEGEQKAALHAFAARNRCSDFTSGCTMRLASIGATRESTSEVLLAPLLELETPAGPRGGEGLFSEWTAPRACSGQPAAEVLASTPMPTLHILTCDWLVQNAPCLLAPHVGLLTTNMSQDEFAAERATLHAVGTELSGGSFVATVEVQGTPMRVTVDTGAACYLSLGKQASAKLRDCRPTGKTMRQVGANGERICAHAVRAHVGMCGVAEDVPVLINDLAIDSEDGYLGWCFLRHFDLCVTKDVLYARRTLDAFDATLLDGVLSAEPCAVSPPACAEASPAGRRP